MGKTWFKFYGQEFLSDPKMLSLTAVERALWVTMLCLASASSEEGVIKYISEEKIIILTNISPLDDEWNEQKGFLEKFEKLGMVVLEEKKITIKNFGKRQESSLSNAERQARYRAKRNESNEELSNESNEKVTNREEGEKRREEKRRRERDDTSKKYLTNIPLNDLEEFHKSFICSKSQIKEKAESLFDYCQSRGKVYKDYKSFLRNALRRDFGIRKQEESLNTVLPNEVVSEQKLAEFRVKRDEILKRVVMKN